MGTRVNAPMLQAQLRPPPMRPGVVARPKLIDRLTSSPEARVVTIVAPAGYGKSTLLSLWRQREPRPVAWLGLDRYHNDPAVLHSALVVALQRAGMIGELPAGDVRVPSDMVTVYGVARTADALDTSGVAGVVMVDQAEAIESPTANDVIAELAVRLPPHIRLAVASRVAVRLPVARLRAQGALLELSATDLAMDAAEAQQLLTWAGVDVGDGIGDLVDRTEGWPAGLYLAAVVAKAGSSRRPILAASGKDRFVADYLREEVLARASDDHMSFLLLTSILDRFCGPLCDAVLGTTGSAATIEDLVASDLLVVPMDRTRDWYRYHHLLQEFLQAELARRRPEIVTDLHRRAAAWFEANDLPDEAITHAQAADDADTVARVVMRATQRTFALGRADTVHEWLRWFEETGRLHHHPVLTAFGGIAWALIGNSVDADRWADALPPDTPNPVAKVLFAMLARNGVAQIRADAQAALQVRSANPTWQAAALVMEGLADLWEGELDRADALFARAVLVGEWMGLPAITRALGGRAAIAVERGKWDDAAEHVARSLDLIRERGLEHYSTSGLTFAIATRCAVHQGQLDLARRRLARATALRPLYTTATPGLSVNTLLELARAHLALSDVTGALTVIRQSGGILAERPDLGLLSAQHDEFKKRLDAMQSNAVGASALTTAELRLLPYLVTHLSFPEIGERLYISRNTVKTQAMSIYRKLNASSRSEAVQNATEAGLLAT